MPFTPFSFDESVAQTEPGRPHVPEGYYLLTKIKMEPTPEDYEKTTGVYTMFRFKEGPSHAPSAGVGREIRDYSALGTGQRNGRGTQFGFGMLLGALGFAGVAKKLPGQQVSNYAELQNLIGVIDQRTGQTDVVALLADNAGTNGRVFSSIEEFLPAADWPTLKGTQLSPMTGPRAMPSGGPGPNGAAAVATPRQVSEISAAAAALFEDN